ncbi:glycerol uptake facilitator protein [Breoghania corrubedonensis]|uniref:Glycerol uptake facilitator protein n=1 Tax=Breoghania corrubedonensis TaxID=665038 RepID=A0A2T5UNY4_9HYPH|nr:MIP/aquaporin family protein [Breoghania corrubedonensis]PTW53225.1 glycerol uptake facilitator protein [Breoghania corrubedonensis]
MKRGIISEMAAEGLGTFILVLFGVGSVAVSVWTGGLSLWPVSMMFALGVAFGVYVSAKVTGGHINPAVTITLAVFMGFPWSKVAPYIIAQFIGAMLAAAAIYWFYADIIAVFETGKELVRGAPGSQLSGMGFGTYAPNPAFFGTTPEAFAQVSLTKWFLSEAFTTAILVFGVLYLTDPHNTAAPSANLAPFFIGLLVAALVAYEAPISMTAMNPARDLGPRVMSYFFGWGEMALPGPRGGWWIPTVSTIIGGLVAGAFYRGYYKFVFEAYDTDETSD